MAQYRKKPVVVEAYRYGFDRRPPWAEQATIDGIIVDFQDESGEPYCVISTLEGRMICNLGDYIIQGVEGEIYPCDESIFQKTYEPVEEAA